MRSGIFSWFGYPLPLAERLALVAGAGFETTSLWLGAEEELVARGQADSMPALVRDAGLELEYVHAPYKGCDEIWTASHFMDSETWDLYTGSLRYCQRHDIPTAVFHLARSSVHPGELDRGLAFLSALAQEGEDLGVVVALENTRHNEVLDRVFEGLDSAFLGLCYDSSHDGLEGQDLGGLLRRWGGRLCVTHLSDNSGGRDDHSLPFRGDLDWSLIRDSLDWKAWRHPFHLEVLPDREEDAKAFLAHAMAALGDLASLLGDQPG
jgi:sugar phosphate isomerase/epimerase